MRICSANQTLEIKFMYIMYMLSYSSDVENLKDLIKYKNNHQIVIIQGRYYYLE